MSIKEAIICHLEAKRGQEISGQALADMLGVSRVAVWKAIKSLKSDGYSISATRNKGYMLSTDTDILSEYGIRQYMNNSLDHWQIILLDTVDSTNNYAKGIVPELQGGPAVVVADHQTAGRGRRGNSFFSPSGTGIYMSVVTQPELSPATLITVAAAVAVCKACEELTKISPQIKWVNDIFVENRKICGILTEGIINVESNTLDTVIIGIGVNLSTESFPDEIKDIAGSIGSKEINRNMLIGKILNCLSYALSSDKETILTEYKRRLMVLGKSISYMLNGEAHFGIAKDINDIGNLIVETQSGTDVLTAGEISINKDFLNQ